MNTMEAKCTNCDQIVDETNDEVIQCEACGIYSCPSCKSWIFNKFCGNEGAEESSSEVDIYGSPICDSCINK